jgi:hypothetical protein
MTKQVTATISFILHEDLEEATDQVILVSLTRHLDANRILQYLIDCTEDPRVGAAQYDTVKLLDVTVVEVEE